jgi:hypothetical protein
MSYQDTITNPVNEKNILSLRTMDVVFFHQCNKREA